jgi:hypothetical protein
VQELKIQLPFLAAVFIELTGRLMQEGLLGMLKKTSNIQIGIKVSKWKLN